MKRIPVLFTAVILIILTLGLAAYANATGENDLFLPLVVSPEPTPTPPSVELRGLWVSRFDWTSYGQAANPAKIDEIVQNAADAGFNALFFQVRGTADAFYQSDLEPWAQRVSGGALGQAPDPLWDPLAYMVEQAHTAGLQVHAYLNVYPVWGCGDPPAADVTPTPLYHQLITEHGETDGVSNGLQQLSDGTDCLGGYRRGTPASIFLDDHLIAVGKDLVTRYDIDGIHLDHIRYGGSAASCDPVSADRYGAACNFNDAGYGDWQRAQVNGTVRRFYEEVVPLKPGLWLSAAVWPIHQLDPAWGFSGHPQQGYIHYYQDSKAWLAGGYIDSISPMIYPGSGYNGCDANGDYIEDETTDYWLRSRWETLVTDFQADGNGRYIIPGIGTGYCNFDEIAARIEMSRQIGTAGHALFSYGDLLANDYFDDLANGPYAETAVPPTITWHP